MKAVRVCRLCGKAGARIIKAFGTCVACEPVRAMLAKAKRDEETMARWARPTAEERAETERRGLERLMRDQKDVYK